ncbi:MAG: hypothetical protein ACK4JE_05915 [Endomicrobiia bacterium]
MPRIRQTILPPKIKTIQRQQIDLHNFVGGLNLQFAPTDIAENEVQDCQNVLFDEEVGKVIKRKGSAKISTLPENLSVVRYYIYKKPDGSEYHIVQTSNGKVFWSVDLQTWNFLVALSAVYPADFITFENYLWITNKQEKVLLWDGDTSNKGTGTIYWEFDAPGETPRTWSAKGYTIFPYLEVGTNYVPQVPKGRYFEIHQNRLFIANTSDLADEIRFSRFYASYRFYGYS